MVSIFSRSFTISFILSVFLPLVYQSALAENSIFNKPSERCDRFTENAAFLASITPRLQFTEATQPGQEIFYKIVNNSESNQLLVPPIKLDSAASVNKLQTIYYSKYNLGGGVMPHDIDVTIVVYGLSYKAYKVAVPIRLILNSNKLTSEAVELEGGGQYSRLKGDFHAKVSIIKNSQIMINSSYSHSDSGYFNQDYQFRSFGSCPQNPFTTFTADVKTDITVDIMLPTRLNSFISLQKDLDITSSSQDFKYN